MATFKIIKNTRDKYYWILKSDKNHEIICMSSENYNQKQNTKKSIEWVKINAKNAQIIDTTTQG